MKSIGLNLISIKPLCNYGDEKLCYNKLGIFDQIKCGMVAGGSRLDFNEIWGRPINSGKAFIDDCFLDFSPVL